MIVYDDAEYAHTRLAGTVVKLNEGLVYVERVTTRDNVPIVKYFHITRIGSDLMTCRLDDIDTTPINLGYVDLDTGAMFVARAPMRQDWRQGLRLNNLRNARGQQININLDKLLQPHLNQYTSLAEASRVASRTGYTQAFSRNFAVSADGSLIHKGRSVCGQVEGGMPTLLPRFNFLAESLQESLV